MSRIHRFPILVATAAVSLALCANASAQLTIGQLPSAIPTTGCVGGGVEFFQARLTSGPAYAAPSDGLLTSWSTWARAGKGQNFELKVFHPVGPGSWTVVAHDTPRPLAPKVINTFAVNIPVHAGDLIGVMDLEGGSPTACIFGSGDAGDLVGGFFGDTPDGGSFTEAKQENFSDRVNVSATFLGLPTIASLGVAEGSVEGGSQVVIGGSEFARVSGVAFGGIPAQSFTVDSEGQVTAVAPAVDRPGRVPVTVSTAVGIAASSQLFSYQGCVVPKLRGKLLKAAKKKIRDADCGVGKLVRRKGATAKSGRVVKQVPRPGGVLAPGTKIRVTLGR